MQRLVAVLLLTAAFAPAAILGALPMVMPAVLAVTALALALAAVRPEPRPVPVEIATEVSDRERAVLRRH